MSAPGAEGLVGTEAPSRSFDPGLGIITQTILYLRPASTRMFVCPAERSSITRSLRPTRSPDSKIARWKLDGRPRHPLAAAMAGSSSRLDAKACRHSGHPPPRSWQSPRLILELHQPEECARDLARPDLKWRRPSACSVVPMLIRRVILVVTGVVSENKSAPSTVVAETRTHDENKSNACA